MSVKWFADRVEKKVVGATISNLYKAVFLVEGDAKRIVPVDTGRLKSTITGTVENNMAACVSAGGDRFPAFDGTNVEYAACVELGTVKMAARPYLRPALEMNKAKILRLFT